MNEHAFDYSIRSELPARPEDPASLGAKFLTTLDALSGIDPIFADWQVMQYHVADSYPLATARPRITAVIERTPSGTIGITRTQSGATPWAPIPRQQTPGARCI